MKKILLALIACLNVTILFGQATIPFVCNDGFGYLFQGSPANVFQVNLQTGVSSLVKNNIMPSGAVSAGYNPVDNFIWIINKTTRELAKVDANWNITTYPTNMPSNIHVADVDKNGIFYGYANGKIYRYDLNTTPPTALSTINSGGISVSDFAFNPIDGFIYGVANNGRIFKTNPANGSSTVVRTIGGLPNQTYGAVYFDANGTLYVNGNSNGQIYKISNAALSNPASTEDAVFFSNGPSASSNDGARCSTAPLCKVGTTTPTLNQASAVNTCSSNSVNLATISASNTPDGTVLTWHTGTPTTTANKITNLTISTSGTYYATFFDAENDCYSASNQPFVVTINPIPTAPTGISVNNNTRCIGESANLSGTCAVGTINWYVNSTNGTFIGTGSPRSVTPNSTTTYVATCKTTSPNCESPTSNSITVTVNPKPAAPSIVAGSTRICSGTSTTLTAQGCSGTVNWSTGASSPSITVNPTTQTTYSATCTNAAGCISNASNSTIDITIASIFFYVDRTNVCSGESVTLTMGGCAATREFFANGVSISSSMSDTYINNPTINVTYTAKCGGVDVTACATNSTAGVPITVRTTPAPPTLSGGTTICAGSSTTLTAAGCAGTVNWSNSQTGNSISVSPSTNTAYTATCLENGCISVSSSPVNVVVENIPNTPTGLSDATICQGTSVNLGGSCATGSVVWYSNSNLSTTVTMPVSPASSRNYYAVCATANCASSSVTVPVVVNPTPAAATGATANPSTICSGASTVLSGSCSGGSSIAFFSDMSLNTRLASSTVAPSSNITYYAACELAGCKSNGTSVSVTVNPSPIPPTGLTAPTTICQGTSTTLNGTCPGGSTIQWYQGVVDASSLVGTNTGLSVSPSETTIYVATCKSNANSCESTQSSNINISVAATPSAPTNFAVSSVAICSGTAITLTGNCTSGTIRFYTDTDLTALVTSPNTPTSTTTYYASCVIGVCKSAPVNKVVNVTATPLAPTAVSASKETVCLNEATTLSANCVSGTVKWYTDAALTTETSSTVNPTTTAAYYVSCVNAGCKSPSGNITINVVPMPPTPTALSSSPAAICKDATYSLSANCSSGTLTWYSDAALTSTINPINRTATTAETFYAACETSGCTGTSLAFTTTVNELPNAPTITPSDRNLCLGGSLSLTASGCNGTINWTINGSAGPNTAIINQTPTITTVYTATCTNTSSGCVSVASAPTTITIVTPPPTPSITSSNSEVCAGESFTLTSINCSGTTNWFESGNATTLGTTNPITITPTATQTYFATCTTSATVIQCESGSSDPISVSYKTTPSAPSISVTKSTICVGESTTLSATGCSGTVTWSDGNTGNSVSVTPTENTTYTATCVENGCTSGTSSSSIAITVNAIPEAPTSLSAASICSGASSNLEGTCANSSAITWYTDAALTTTTAASVSPASTNTYYAACELNGCKSTGESVVVNVTATPAAPSVAASPTTVCVGTSSELTGTCTSGDLKWYSEVALTNELSSTTVSPTTTTTYFAACVSGVCKSTPTQQEITVNALPAAPTLSTTSTTVCSTSSFDITAAVCTGTVNWSNGQTGNSITVSLTTDQSFTATCTDANGCVSPVSTPLAITVVPIPDLPVISPSNSEICPGASVMLTAAGCSGTLNWFNSAAPTTSISTNPNLTVTPSVSSSYFVTCIVSSANCSSGESEAAAVTIKALPTITEILPLTCTDASNALYAFQTSGGSASTVAVTNGLTASFDTDGRDGAVTPDTRQVWVIENIPSNQAFTVNVTENGCVTSTSLTAPDCGTATAFPVDLLSFKGEISDEKVTLNWLTANEIGIQQFEIEKSRDAVNFYKIGTVAAKNSTENQLYSFDDSNPILAVNYYRLRIKEFDVADSFSKIIAIDFRKRSEFQWKLFPNPFEAGLDYITIETNGKAEIKSVDLYSINGSRLQTKLDATGVNSYQLSIGTLPAGTYLIQLHTNAGFFTKKLVIIK